MPSSCARDPAAGEETCGEIFSQIRRQLRVRGPVAFVHSRSLVGGGSPLTNLTDHHADGARLLVGVRFWYEYNQLYSFVFREFRPTPTLLPTGTTIFNIVGNFLAVLACRRCAYEYSHEYSCTTSYYIDM
eukprot:COSAG01_NODE_92_length_27199_cov_100.594649_12_plen_130_part_00